jgi:peptidoglycan-associated lipoprotein
MLSNSAKKLAFVLVAALAATLMTACPGPEWPKCENDDHCKADKKGNAAGKDMVCVFGQCMECGRDSDCGADSKCNEGRCEKLCKADADCASGLTCNESGDCVNPPPKAECEESGDCETGFSCTAGKCVQDTTPVDTGPDCAARGTVNFEFNLYDLTPEARETLDTFAKCMAKNAGWKMTVEGHADERGTTQYNLDLGDKRARSVKDYLERLGVKGDRMRTVSFGEERPVSSRSDEEGWAANRRAELVIKK